MRSSKPKNIFLRIPHSSFPAPRKMKSSTFSVLASLIYAIFVVSSVEGQMCESIRPYIDCQVQVGNDQTRLCSPLSPLAKTACLCNRILEQLLCIVKYCPSQIPTCSYQNWADLYVSNCDSSADIPAHQRGQRCTPVNTNLPSSPSAPTNSPRSPSSDSSSDSGSTPSRNSNPNSPSSGSPTTSSGSPGASKNPSFGSFPSPSPSGVKSLDQSVFWLAIMFGFMSLLFNILPLY
ncbi:hypothetical protein BKA69DRAFT_1123180 [Paraphysoderma sedebokerense]|nr:hypothetical protein BKA69DRAFT_1123180 [Paraphysoderma sedebokerense]